MSSQPLPSDSYKSVSILEEGPYLTHHSIITLSVAHQKSWIAYLSDQPSPFEIVSTMILQQTQLAASLIPATIPNLKAFPQSLYARWGEAALGSGHTTNVYGTFETSNLNSGRHTTPRPQTRNRFSAKSRPDFEMAGERSPRGSGESQDGIIRNETVGL